MPYREVLIVGFFSKLLPCDVEPVEDVETPGKDTGHNQPTSLDSEAKVCRVFRIRHPFDQVRSEVTEGTVTALETES